ncbi:HAD hydrolase-like protein [Bacillus sp. 1P06AnD]|uniref:HAD hydrolase-like protein n=1 Tax=Bacillus sp. 1P06AnD TaxID=3132208 RepID=UPI0039A1D4B1
MTKKYVLFDFDGTLADSGKVAIEAINQLAEVHGFPKIQASQFQQLQASAAIGQQQNTEAMGAFSAVADDFYAIYKQSLHKIPLFPGIREMLEALHANGIGVAVVSSNEESNIRDYFKAQRLSFITEVYTSSDLFGKASMIKDFCGKHGLHTGDVLYVGDEARDIRACHQADTDVIWVDWGFDGQEEAVKENPTYMVSSPQEIVEISLSNGKKE